MDISMSKLTGLLGLLTIMLPSCGRVGIGFTKIEDLVAHPQKFSAQEVQIRGKVTNVFKLPFVATKIYSVQDGSGELNVRTEREVPIAGSEVRVKGVLDTLTAIGDQHVGLYLREVARW